VNGSLIGTSTVNTANISGLANGDAVSCRLTGSLPCTTPPTVTSESVLMTVVPLPGIPGPIVGSNSACAGDELTYTATPATNADSYVWTVPFGWPGSSTGANISTVAGNVGGQVTVAAVNLCGTSLPQTLNVTSFPAFTQVSGEVQLLGTPVLDGWIYTYLMQAGSGYTKADSAQITDGQYSFGNLELYPVPYILRAMPDLDLYPLAVPTYYAQNGMSFQWDNPDLDYDLNTECGASDERDFDLVVSEFSAGQGNSTLTGTVFWGAAPGKMEAEDPIPGVDVVVERVPPGNAFAYDVTDNEGRYVFEDVPVLPQVGSVYRIYVSIPGTPMDDTYSISIIVDGTEIDNLDFVVDTVTNLIYPLGPTNVSVDELGRGQLAIHPNPMSDMMTVQMPRGGGMASSYRISGMDGRIHRETAVTPNHRITVERGNLAAGVYMLEITATDGHRSVKRFIAH
jgi:hypothetical protein